MVSGTSYCSGINNQFKVYILNVPGVWQANKSRGGGGEKQDKGQGAQESIYRLFWNILFTESGKAEQSCA
jgi:hypothetical protein